MSENEPPSTPPKRFRVGVPPFLNVQPLIYGLKDHPAIQLYPQPPAHLAALLDQGELEAALVPSIDYWRNSRHWQLLPAGVIASQGEVLTVRVFSHQPLDRIEELSGDLDSHTSVVLVQVLWHLMYNRPLRVNPLNARDNLSNHQAILLIGDKVIPQLGRWEHELDLGLAWNQTTGLPFVFALWAAPIGSDVTELTAILNHSRQQGLAHIPEIATQMGLPHGFNPDQAERYLTHHLHFAFGDQENRGLQRFFEFVHQFKLSVGPPTS